MKIQSACFPLSTAAARILRRVNKFQRRLLCTDTYEINKRDVLKFINKSSVSTNIFYVVRIEWRFAQIKISIIWGSLIKSVSASLYLKIV